MTSDDGDPASAGCAGGATKPDGPAVAGAHNPAARPMANSPERSRKASCGFIETSIEACGPAPKLTERSADTLP